jgi:uncharacterized repeat protein (TIGR03803 family)
MTHSVRARFSGFQLLVSAGMAVALSACSSVSTTPVSPGTSSSSTSGSSSGSSTSSSSTSSSTSSSGATPPQTYTLSGSVSGLSSSGLVLSVNSTGVPVASGASTVTLASGLTSGTAFSVSVQTQPTGETCSVAGGMGTIASANYANVVVTCATQAYSLGGTVSGLSSTGLVLANGSNSVTVASGASSFTLPTAVAFGSSYNVTVSTQPAGQSCAVAHGSSTMPAAAVTSVAVTCTSQPFTVGGTISGLGANTGLVLTNGSDTLNVPAGSTTFTMPTAVNYGVTYSIMAQSPAGLTCTVSNGTAPMGAANVTNVAVVCSDLSYNLGGTISGLSAAGLVLSNGTDTLTVPSGSTSFTMPTPVAFGSAYNVMASTQPTGETCSVASGTGNMPVGGFTGVTVTCAVNTYTVGGTISGLTATGLVLLDNGGDATTINANATTFTMNTPVAYGSGYSISVQTQPGGETCQITQGSGTNVIAIVTSVVISCAPWSTFTTSVLYSFAGGLGDGENPDDSLIQGSDGNLYGNTYGGGANSDGTVFRLTTAGAETLLYSFGSIVNDAINPYGSLIQGVDGNLYGTTGTGGASGNGTIFKVTLTPTVVESLVHSFAGGSSDGSRPNSIIQGSDGNFYGTTPSGGANGAGTVYSMTPAGVETLLWSFGGSGDGSSPQARLVQGSDGNFYGTTSAGGANSDGTVFMITPTGTETLLYSFGGTAADGTDPVASLIQASDGNFYSTTTNGGANSLGTVFRITPLGVETVLYSFGTNANDGTYPFARLLQGSDGNLYGTTPGGGANGLGVVFKITLAGVETLIYTFSGGASDGSYPQNSLIQGSDGSFYSTTLDGGTYNLGTVFKIVPQ